MKASLRLPGDWTGEWYDADEVGLSFGRNRGVHELFLMDLITGVQDVGPSFKSVVLPFGVWMPGLFN